MDLRYNIFANTEFWLKKYLPGFTKKGLASASNSQGCKDIDIFTSVYNIATVWMNGQIWADQSVEIKFHWCKRHLETCYLRTGILLYQCLSGFKGVW